MALHMSVENSFEGESCCANSARMVFDSAVSDHMALEVVSIGKSNATHTADEWFRIASHVSGHMLFQLVRLEEALAT